MLTRRHFLYGALAAGGSALGPVYPSGAEEGPSQAPLNLRASEVQRTLLPNLQHPAQLFLYNGQSPGPIIRRRCGERLSILFHNDLAVPSTVHWHGIRIINEMDGVPGLTQQPVLPGESHLYDFHLPDAGTYWYHAHFNSLEQVARGLYGPLIVDGDELESSETEDVVLLLDDWWVGEDGKFIDGFTDWTQGKPGGRIGNVITVNGKPPGQNMVLPTDRPIRLRLINAANAREFFLEFNQPDAHVVAVDGQPLDSPLTIQGSMRLGPAQRLDMVLTLPLSDKVELLEASGTVESGNVLASFTARQSATLPNRQIALKANDLPEPDLSDPLLVPFVMTGGSTSEIEGAVYNGEVRAQSELAKAQQVWAFNGTADLPQEPLFRVRRGTSVRLIMENRTGWSHAMHVHGHHFRVLDSRDELDRASWRDTVMIDRNQKLDIAFFADNPGRWLLHCHMLQHAVSGMRTWFEVE